MAAKSYGIFFLSSKKATSTKTGQYLEILQISVILFGKKKIAVWGTCVCARVCVLPENREWLHTPPFQSRLGSDTPDQTSQVQFGLQDKHIITQTRLILNLLNTMHIALQVKSLGMVNSQGKLGIYLNWKSHNIKKWLGIKIIKIFQTPSSIKIISELYAHTSVEKI